MTNDVISHTTLLTIVVALFVAAIGSPLGAMLIQTRLAKQDLGQDRARRDTHYARTEQSLESIHALANSNLMSAQKRELDAARLAFVAIREVITLKQDAGLVVLPEATAAAINLEAQVAALSREMRIRQDIADGFNVE